MNVTVSEGIQCFGWENLNTAMHINDKISLYVYRLHVNTSAFPLPAGKLNKQYISSTLEYKPAKAMLHYAPHRSELQMVPKGTKPGHLQVLTYPGNNTQIWCSRTQPNPTSNTPSISLSYWAFHWLHAYETSLVCKSKSVGNNIYI